MFSLHRESSSMGIIDLEEDIIWEMKQRHESMRRIKSDIFFPSLKPPGSSSVMRFQKETLSQTMATMIPDQVLMNVKNNIPETFSGCLLSGKIFGVMELMQVNERNGKSANQMTKTLNRYLAAIIEESMSFEGDIMNLSADSFLVLFKSTSVLLLKYYVHSAINCALVIQKKIGKFVAEEGILLKVHLAITAGSIVFFLLVHPEKSCYVCLGPPVDEIEQIEEKSVPGDIVVAPSAWAHVNASEYTSVATEDLQYYKILGVSSHWKCAGREHLRMKASIRKSQEPVPRPDFSVEDIIKESQLMLLRRQEDSSLRPALLDVKDMRDDLAKFLIPPVMITLNAQEPMESLIETRQMVFMHLKVKMERVGVQNLDLLNQYYKIICNVAIEHKGVVMRCLIVQGDVTFVVLFGLRGFTSAIESQEALRCAVRCRHEIDLFEEVQTVSVSCATGKSYCGIFGHSVRKEYMIVSKLMFKSSRMGHAYPGKITCDRSTFIYSNLEADNFTLLELEHIEGLAEQSPIYEYKEEGGQVGLPKDTRLPILGRDEEIVEFSKLFEVYLQNFSIKPCSDFAKYSFKNCIIIEATYKQGKSRLLEELSTRVGDANVQKIDFHESDYMISYNSVRLVMEPHLGLGKFPSEYFRRKQIKREMGEKATTELLYVLNDVFDVNFKLAGHTLVDKVKLQLRKKCMVTLCKKYFIKPTLIVMDHAEYMDMESSNLLLAMLETKRFFLIVAVDETRKGPTHLGELLDSHHVQRFALKAIPKIYLAGLACQFLGVYAIPVDLEKMPPVSVEYYKALLEEKTKDQLQVTDAWSVYIDSCRDAFQNVDVRRGLQEIFCKETVVPVCLLTGKLEPERDVDPNVTDDLHFLEKYDRFSYEEQTVLRCSSVLGDPFTRRLLFFMWMPVCERDAGEVLQKLFEKEVICCAGGDFSLGGDYILLRNRSYDPTAERAVDCRCVALNIHDSCLFMPKYASCGFMRFRSESFGRTVHDLIPDEERKELHLRAAKFIQKETRRCVSCGCGYFPTRTGFKMDNNPMGRTTFDAHKKRKTPQLEQMDVDELFYHSTHLSGRATMTRSRATLSSHLNGGKSFIMDKSSETDLSYDIRHAESSKLINPLAVFRLRKRPSLVRTFSKSDFLSCECHLILNNMFKRLKRHFIGSEQWHEMIITCINYIKISLANQNFASCMGTIKEALNILENRAHLLNDPKWKINMLIAKFYGLKGNVLLDLDEAEEAYETFLKAMKTFGLSYPKNEKSLSFTLKLYHQTWKHRFRLYFSPGSYLNETDDVAQLYISNSIAETTLNLCKIHIARGEWRLAELAVLMSFKNSLQTETNLIRICDSFSYMMIIAQHYERRLMCICLEVHALKYCHKKRNFVEAPELRAVSDLYLTIFEARMARAEFESALQVGYIAISIATKCNNMPTIIKLFTLIAVILFDRMIISDATTILRELEYFADEIENNSGRTWYYSLAVMFHLETGYILCPFSSVEMHYHAEDFTRSQKYCEAKMRLMITMWVWYLRNNRYEDASMFKKELQIYRDCEIDSNNRAISNLYLLEGTLLTLVNRINKRSISGMIEGKGDVQRLLKKLHQTAAVRPFISARLYLLEAYYSYILETVSKTKKFLNRARKFCLKFEDKLVLLHVEHSEKAWNNELTSSSREFWKNHCKAEAYISYHEMDMDDLKIYCYTYPKPLFRI